MSKAEAETAVNPNEVFDVLSFGCPWKGQKYDCLAEDGGRIQAACKAGGLCTAANCGPYHFLETFWNGENN